jgi:hypothetical protein
MAKPAKVTNSEAAMVDGREVIVFSATDEAGTSVQVCIPAEGLGAVFAHAERQLRAVKMRGQPSIPGWSASLATPGTPCEVGILPTKEGEKVVLMIHLGRPTEQHLLFSPGDARELGAELSETAERASGAAPTRN